jgi:hypothetical protein
VPCAPRLIAGSNPWALPPAIQLQSPQSAASPNSARLRCLEPASCSCRRQEVGQLVHERHPGRHGEHEARSNRANLDSADTSRDNSTTRGTTVRFTGCRSWSYARNRSLRMGSAKARASSSPRFMPPAPKKGCGGATWLTQHFSRRRQSCPRFPCGSRHLASDLCASVRRHVDQADARSKRPEGRNAKQPPRNLLVHSHLMSYLWDLESLAFQAKTSSKSCSAASARGTRGAGVLYERSGRRSSRRPLGSRLQ